MLGRDLHASVVKRVPAWVHAHLDWMETIQSTARRDRAELAKIPLGGRAITEAEIDDLGFRIEFARDALVEHEVPVGAVLAGADPSQMRDYAGWHRPKPRANVAQPVEPARPVNPDTKPPTG